MPSRPSAWRFRVLIAAASVAFSPDTFFFAVPLSQAMFVEMCRNLYFLLPRRLHVKNKGENECKYNF